MRRIPSVDDILAGVGDGDDLRGVVLLSKGAVASSIPYPERPARPVRATPPKPHLTWDDFPPGFTWDDIPAGLTWENMKTLEDLGVLR